jgi:hypothetical protein
MTEVQIERLTTEAKSNPVWNAVAHVFALRERARSQVTIQALMQKMREEGFNWDRKDYEQVLRLLASVGVGRLVSDSKGRPLALVDIKLTLQSIGKVAAGGSTEVQGFRRKSRFGRLAGPMVRRKRRKARATKTVEVRRPTRQPRPYQTPAPRLILTVIVNDKPVNIPVPNDFAPEDVAKLISDLQGG